MSLSLKDVAPAAKVSVATVSRALGHSAIGHICGQLDTTSGKDRRRFKPAAV